MRRGDAYNREMASKLKQQLATLTSRDNGQINFFLNAKIRFLFFFNFSAIDIDLMILKIENWFSILLQKTFIVFVVIHVVSF